MLGLKLPTDPRWIDLAQISVEEILIDHAYCEQKAASSCISLIVQYADKKEIVEALTPIVAEEWSHFERVIDEMNKRGMNLGKARKDEYVAELNKSIRKGGSREQQLVEKLLLNALIEARSCERFKLLYENHPEEYLRKFYYDFMVSEAGHYRNFIDLAKKYMPLEYVKKRWEEFLEEEKMIISMLTVRGDRMH
ncbi:tRNA-(ms[2]io[6]A)-hydroxylase [Hyphobacterium sp. CCMP332]|nr:tRNA-(ms[2]io[6]A)-hydroxylase [Hyphobacterium sp. CCMP332]